MACLWMFMSIFGSMPMAKPPHVLHRLFLFMAVMSMLAPAHRVDTTEWDHLSISEVSDVSILLLKGRVFLFDLF